MICPHLLGHQFKFFMLIVRPLRPPRKLDRGGVEFCHLLTLP